MDNVLLLNASFAPLRVLSYKRAVVLVLEDKAEVIEETEVPLRHAGGALRLPSVIRLKYMVQIPFKARMPVNRKNVMARDNYECQMNDCTRRGTTIDHVLPRSRGGKHEWTNVVACCSKCNSKKGNRLMSELGWTLKREPHEPRKNIWLVAGIREKEEWEPYLAYA